MHSNEDFNDDRRQNKGILLVSFIWIVALVSAGFVAWLQQGLGLNGVPYFLAAIAPALMGVLLFPVMGKEWAQITLIFAWIALAITATLAIAFVPMAFLFLCAPAAAALFEREKVVEAMVLSALAAGIVYYAHRFGFASAYALPAQFEAWGRTTAPVATIVFMVGAMYAAASKREQGVPVVQSAATADSDNALTLFPGKAFQVDAKDNVILTSTLLLESIEDSRLTDDSDTGDDSEVDTGLSLLKVLDSAQGSKDIVLHALKAARDSGEDQSIYTRLNTSADNNTDSDNKTDNGASHGYMRVDIAPAQDGGAFVYLQDVTQSLKRVKALEGTLGPQNLANIEHVEDKSLFFAGVSHELRTPLNAIIGFSDMMRARLFGPLPGKYSEYADLIHESGQHMLDLVGDVLDVSKIGAGQYELTHDEFDIADVVRSSVKMVMPSADAAFVSIETDFSEDLPLSIKADRRAVRQIILNLLSNSIKFTPKGGAVKVSAQLRQGDTVLTVSDNGAGISQEELSTLGTPYMQGASGALSQKRGTGLGLSLVKSLTELHSGSFDVKSETGNGTVVTITLPNASD